METHERTLLIVGAGHAGSELAIAARQGGWSGPVKLVGDDIAVPYHRPPLSKGYLSGTTDAQGIELRPGQAYETARIERLAGVRVTAFDRAARSVALHDGRTLRYDVLALCLGGRPRALACEGMATGIAPTNLFYLRTQADADRLREQLQPGRRLAIVGGGYVGLEVAASARKLGVDVTVLEAQPRVLARVAGPDVSAFYEDVHRAHGVTLHLGAAIRRLVREGDRIVAIDCDDGTRIHADAVVAGVGMLPDVDLALAAGLGTPEGLAVDENGATADPAVFAAGDCTRYHHPLYDRDVRIESVPNALEQARAVAGWLCGKPRPNHSVPWFWSDQYDLKLQMAGLSLGHDRCVLRGLPASHSFCAFYLRGERLLAVDAVNRPAEFMVARRALARPLSVDADALADETVPLKLQLA